MAKPYWKTCPRSKMVRAVLADALPENVVLLARAEEREARTAMVAGVKAYCVARCGGCPLTDGIVPPP